MLPGVSNFEAPVTGTYRFHGNTVRVIAPFSNSTGTGTLYMEIDTTTFGSTLRISQQIVYSNGGLPIYMTIIGT
jgi:hypothetical protein